MNAAEILVKKLLAARKNPAPAASVAAAPALPAALPAPSALPAVGTPGGVAVPKFDTVSPVARKFLRDNPVEHSADDRALRDEKILFVRLVEEHRAATGASDAAAVLAVAAARASSFPLLAHAGKNGRSALHYANLRNWRDGNAKRPALRNPATGLVDYSRGDLLLKNYGRTHERYGDPRFWTEILAACNNLSDTQVRKSYRLLVAKYTREAPDAAIPSLAQIYYELKKLPRRLLDLNRRGESYYLQHYRDYNERDPESIQANEGWVADTQMCDFMIRAQNAAGEIVAVRPWICVIMDIKSEFPVAWEMGADAIDNRIIRNSFGRAVAQYGRPMHFLTDNGSDYLKRGFTTPVVFTPDVANSVVYEHSIMRELAIEHHAALAYNGRAKIVERFFQEMAQYYRPLRGHVGNRPANRPATADVWAKPVTREYLMDIEEACTSMFDMIELYCDTPAVGSKYLRGMTPREAFAPERRLRREPMTPADLYRAFLLPEPQPRIVNPCGSSITVDGKRYVALREQREKMWKYDGKPVMVKFDLNSRDYCYLFDLDGTFLSGAHRPAMLPYFWHTPAERERLGDAQAAIRHEIKSLNTYTFDLTRGYHKLDVASSIGLPPDVFNDPARLRVLDTKHSVKGESHTPAVRVHASEPERAAADNDLKLVCTKKTVFHETPKNPEPAADARAFQKMLVNHLTAAEEPEGTAPIPDDIFNDGDNNNESEFNPYD